MTSLDGMHATPRPICKETPADTPGQITVLGQVKVIPACTPIGLDANFGPGAPSARTLRELADVASPTPPAPETAAVDRPDRAMTRADQLKPVTIEAFGGAYDVLSTNPDVAASPEAPRHVYAENPAVARRIMQHVVGDPVDDSRVAWIETPLGATAEDRLCSHAFGPCQAVVMFWKNDEGRQAATLFHFMGMQSEQKIQSLLDTIEARAGGGISLDSISHILTGNQPGLEASLGKVLTGLADKNHVPLRNLPSKKERFAVAIDVEKHTIVTMPDNSMKGLGLPTPNRWESDRMLIAALSRKGS
jgi:hypothetical protein